MLYDKSSTSLASGLFAQMDFVPKLTKQLQDDPDSVVADLETLRKISVSVYQLFIQR